MTQLDQQPPSNPAAVSLLFVLPNRPSRAAAFEAAMTAALHAGFGFGRDMPGQIVYSQDVDGNTYASSTVLPARPRRTFAQTLAHLAAAAPFYNLSIRFSYRCNRVNVPVCARVYDEPGVLVYSFDFDQTAWNKASYAHAVRSATSALVDAGRVLFTLLPVSYLLIGPTSHLTDLPIFPSRQRLHNVPVTMLADGTMRAAAADQTALYEEQLPRGRLTVHSWNVATLARVQALLARLNFS